jgi:hypothetical protein
MYGTFFAVKSSFSFSCIQALQCFGTKPSSSQNSQTFSVFAELADIPKKRMRPVMPKKKVFVARNLKD